MSNENKVSYHIKTAKTRTVKDGKVCDVAYKRVTKRPNGKITISQITETGTDLIHPDLTRSLKAFIPHFLMLGERANVNLFQPSYFKEEKFYEENSPYEVTGIHIKEKHERQFVIMVGRQKLNSGRGISMVIPMVCFDPQEGDEDAYPFHSQLKTAVENYLSEVEQYLDDKHGQSDQTSMPLETNEEGQEEDPDPEEEGDALDKVISEKKGSSRMKKVS